MPDTGEPKIVQKVRGQFASWAAVSRRPVPGINVGHRRIDHRGSSFPRPAWASGCCSNYAQLWQAGYSWRDVLSRPPAPDAIEAATIGKGGTLPRGAAAAQAGRVRRALPERCSRSTGDRRRSSSCWTGCRPLGAQDAARDPADGRRALQAGDRPGPHASRAGQRDSTPRAWRRSTSGSRRCQREPDDPERARRLNLLERQRQTMWSSRARRGQVASHLESCVLAMQNMRLRPAAAPVGGGGRGAGRSHPGHPAGAGAVARRGQRHQPPPARSGRRMRP